MPITTPEAILGLMVAIIGWFLQREMDGNRVKHEKHFEHATNMEMHETDRERDAHKLERMAVSDELIRHGEQDDRRFARVETTLDDIQRDIKDILKMVTK